jgi:hypothetical protein
LPELREAREPIDTAFKHWPDVNLGNASNQNWFDWDFARILLREATALIDGRPDKSTPAPR